MPLPSSAPLSATSHVLCIDLGGTKSAASRLRVDGQVVFRVSAPTPSADGPDAIVPLLEDLARQARNADPTPLIGMGISAGAPADARRGRVFTAPNLPGWDGADRQGTLLAALLSSALDGLPTYLENDADATALAEHRFGAGRGTRNMAFLTIGTGIGAGLILNNYLHRGRDGAGGEVGHIAVVPGGRVCSCGLRGCLEAYASGPSLVRVAQERGFRGETGQAVMNAARTGDDAARFAVDQAGEMLGRGLATLVMLLNLETIVLGTLAVHAGDLLLHRIRDTVRQLTWPRLHNDLSIVPAALGDGAQDIAALSAFLHGREGSGE